MSIYYAIVDNVYADKFDLVVASSPGCGPIWTRIIFGMDAAASAGFGNLERLDSTSPIIRIHFRAIWIWKPLRFFMSKMGGQLLHGGTFPPSCQLRNGMYRLRLDVWPVLTEVQQGEAPGPVFNQLDLWWAVFPTKPGTWNGLNMIAMRLRCCKMLETNHDLKVKDVISDPLL